MKGALNIVKKVWKRVTALLCAVCLLVSSDFQGILKSEAARMAPRFDSVTFSDFNVGDDTYSANDDLAFEGQTEESLANKTFEGNITFDNDTVNSLNIAGQESGWEGVRLLVDGDGLCFGEAYERFDYVYIDELIAQTTVIGEPVDIKLSFEVADTDNDGDEDDVRFWLYFENVLYNNAPIMEALNYAQYLGNYIGGYTSASSASITVASKVPTVLAEPTFETVTFSNFNVEDDTYSANDDLGFEGQTEGSLANKTFEGTITFDNDTVNSLNIAGQESGWEGVRLLFDGENLCFGEAYERFDYVYIDESLAQTTVIGEPVDIKLSFEVADTDSDGAEDDVRFWLYFEDVLYNESPIMEAVDYAQYLGNYIGGYTSASSASITVASKVIEEIGGSIFDTITFDDLGLEDGTYSYNNENLATSGFYKDGFANKTFTGNISFSSTPQTNINFAGKDTGWQGVALFTYEEGLYFGETEGLFDAVWLDVPLDMTYNVKITFEVVDADGDGRENDVRFWFYIEDQLYGEGPIVEAIDYAQKLGNYIGICSTCEDSSVVIQSCETSGEQVDECKETEERYNLQDGPYLISGTGTITVNGEECAAGTTLTEPGTYRIISQDGHFIRNVELYDAGAKSTSLTYDKDVMPIVGFYGPLNEEDTRGNRANHITEEVYQKLDDAGINFITHIQEDWAAPSNRGDILGNLIFAEQHNIGFYVMDSGLFDSSLEPSNIAKSIAQYSEYDSFKGIFVADEPRTQTYDQDNEKQLDNYKDVAGKLNGYSNLSGYMSILPYMPEKGNYEDYLEEYIEKTNPKILNWGNYVFSDGTNKERYFENLAIVRDKSLSHNIAFWPSLQVGSNWNDGIIDLQPTDNDTPTEGQLLWNVNTCLAYGAKGISYFPLIQPNHFAYETDNAYDYERNGLLGANGEPTKWYEYVQKANRQIAAVDEVLLNSTSKAVLAKGTAAQTDSQIAQETYGCVQEIGLSNPSQGALIGAFDYQGKDAFYMVNYNTESIEEFCLYFDDTYEYRLIQDGETSYHKGSDCYVVIPAGEAVLVVVEDYVVSYDGMKCFSPEDYALEYRTYTEEEIGGECSKITSMDKVLFKTNITFSGGTGLCYMKSDVDNPWTGIKLQLNANGEIEIYNDLTQKDIYVDGNPINYDGYYVLYPQDAFDNPEITTFDGQEFELTLTTEFVDYDGKGQLNDLKLGIYIDGDLYIGQYAYIKDCQNSCMSNVYLYRYNDGNIKLASSALYGMELRPELSDSVTMKYIAYMEPSAVEAGVPKMTFEMNGQVLGNVEGELLFPGGSLYVFTYPEVMMQNLADKVTATLTIGEREKIYKYSMLEYCAQILNSATTASSDGNVYSIRQMKLMKNLIVDMIQYASALQVYRGMASDSESLLTNKLEQLVSNYSTYDIADSGSLDDLEIVHERLVLEKGVTSTEVYQWKGASLVIGNKVKIRYKFSAQDVSDLKVKLQIGETVKELSYEETEDKGIYTVEFDEIYAYEYATPILIRFFEGDVQVGDTLLYSVNTYMYNMRNYAGPKAEELKELLYAIHYFGMSASAK